METRTQRDRRRHYQFTTYVAEMDFSFNQYLVKPTSR